MKLGLLERLKNNDLILESEIAQLNQDKKPKQPDWPDAVRKIYFTSETNQ